MSDREITGWRKSTRSQEQGECVELAAVPGGVAVRDSKNPAGPILRMDRSAFSALLKHHRD